jgi:glycopeptide antibiotics resistance protein
MQKPTSKPSNRKKKALTIWKYTVAILYSLLTVYFLLFKIPQNKTIEFLVFPHIDKFAHAFIFALFHFFWSITPIFSYFSFKMKIITTAFLSFFVSVFMEFMQLFTLTRNFEVFDIIFNAIGIMTITIILLRFKKVKKYFFYYEYYY